MEKTSQIIRRAKKRRSKKPSWTKEQEQRYKEVSATLEGQGFTVRREELKRGHCWKVISGTCRSQSEHFIFVDSRLAPPEQIAFLQSKLLDVSAEARVEVGAGAIDLESA
jgi:hypothetical protein